jgi:primary-amine oxidase
VIWGRREKKERAVAIYEQDNGILWKHYDETSGKVEIRRARQLVVSSVTTVGNYDYCLNWIFHQDGTLEARVDLTGILLAKGVVPQKCEKCAAVAAGKTAEASGDQRYGTLVGKSIVAPNHQHIFSFRLDFDIDGRENSVVETSVKPAPPGPENPANNAFIHIETPLKTERAARRDLNLFEHRRWKVFNSTQPNELGHFPGYLLEPGANCVPKVGAESITRKRAGYIDHHFWATQHKDHELHAAGDYPRQRANSEGLPQWSGDESLEQQDVVLWYTMTVANIVEGFVELGGLSAALAAGAVAAGERDQVVVVGRFLQPAVGPHAERAVETCWASMWCSMNHFVRSVMKPSSASRPPRTCSRGSMALPTSCNSAASKNSSS